MRVPSAASLQPIGFSNQEKDRRRGLPPHHIKGKYPDKKPTGSLTTVMQCEICKCFGVRTLHQVCSLLVQPRQGQLMVFHERLTKEKEQLRKKEEQLREKELVLLRQQQTLASASGKFRAIYCSRTAKHADIDPWFRRQRRFFA